MGDPWPRDQEVGPVAERLIGDERAICASRVSGLRSLHGAILVRSRSWSNRTGEDHDLGARHAREVLG
jgi:hypothetical protein